MSETDLIAVARAVAKECEERGFSNTAIAMRDVIEDMILALDPFVKCEADHKKGGRDALLG